MPTRVLHVITGLEIGGAELSLARLLNSLDPKRVQSDVACLGQSGPVADILHAGGHRVAALNAQRPSDAPRLALRLNALLRRDRPDVVQTWLYHADVLGGLSSRALGIPVVWGLRGSDLHKEAFKRRTIALARTAAYLSHVIPAAIVCGSLAAQSFHRNLGYDAERLLVIENGVEIPELDDATSAAVRLELGIPQQARVLGRVGRWHPHKDYPTLLQALRRLAEFDDLHVILCGDGLTPENATLRELIAGSGMARRVHAIGARSDVLRITRAFDVACSSSIGEGFPNVVAEAMAAAVPVIATDVGDTAHVVGDAGLVVPPKSPDALAAALTDVLNMPRAQRAAMGHRGRTRVSEHFSIPRMAQRYEDLYEAVAAREERLGGRPSTTMPFDSAGEPLD